MLNSHSGNQASGYSLGQGFVSLLSSNHIHAFEDFFLEKKRKTMDLVGDETSEQVCDMYIRGFLQSLYEKIAAICPDIA